MKERPILFTAPMVRALLDGSKTQTRRLVKPAPEMVTGHAVVPWEGPADALLRLLAGAGRPCPYGKPGDRLWVRETWRGVVEISPPGAAVEHGVARYIPNREHCRRVEYAATDPSNSEPWRPSIHMPRWASRILLEIVSVRVERLQAISEEDAIAEGIPWQRCVDWQGPGNKRRDFGPPDAYKSVWESINGAGSWDLNPWVWVVEFKRVTP